MSRKPRCMGWLVLLIASAVATANAESVKVVRLAVVNTPQYSGLLDDLLPDFEAETGLTVEI